MPGSRLFPHFPSCLPTVVPLKNPQSPSKSGEFSATTTNFHVLLNYRSRWGCKSAPYSSFGVIKVSRILQKPNQGFQLGSHGEDFSFSKIILDFRASGDSDYIRRAVLILFFVFVLKQINLVDFSFFAARLQNRLDD